MALGLTNRGSGTHNTGATTFTLSPASNLAAGSLAVLCVEADNSSSGGASNDLGTVTDSIGNTWTRQRNPIFDNGAASAGVQTAIYTTPQNIGPLQTGTVITVATPSSPVAKTWTLTEVTRAANAEAVVIGGADQAGATTASPSFASSTIAVGDAVLFMVGMEAGTTQTATADADATNGAWSTQQYAEIGSTTSGSAIASQGKVQTTTPSAQTYNPTLGISSDLIVSYIIIHEQHTGSASVVATGGGVAAPSVKKTARSSPATSAGGVAVATSSSAHSVAVAGTGAGAAVASTTTTRRSSPSITGAGAAVASSTGTRRVSPVATGGGLLVVDYEVSSIENHDGSAVAVGGGAASIAVATARPAAVTATGAGTASPTVVAGRAAGPGATGSGSAVATIQTGRRLDLAASAAGVASVSVLAARQAAMLMSGGGVLALVEASQRYGTTAVTGGGSAAVDGTGGEVHSGSAQATGSGSAGLSTIAGRLVAPAATGAGSAVVDVATARAAAIQMTAPGRASVVDFGAHTTTFAITGSGRTVITVLNGADVIGGPLQIEVDAGSSRHLTASSNQIQLEVQPL